MQLSRISIWQSTLPRSPRKEFLEDLFTVNESQRHQRTPCRLATSEGRVNYACKVELAPQDVLLCCFWASEGMPYYELLLQMHTVNAVVYATQLQKLTEVLWESGRNDLQCTFFMIEPDPMQLKRPTKKSMCRAKKQCPIRHILLT